MARCSPSNQVHQHPPTYSDGGPAGRLSPTSTSNGVVRGSSNHGGVNVDACTECGRGPSETDFPLQGHRCLDCRRAGIRAHYAANREYYKDKARTRQRVVILQTREWLLAYLSEHPCVDCGLTDVRVLEFDHRDVAEKVAAVAVLARAGYPLTRVMGEVEKCDVRCANCHRIRTHEQRDWWGAQLSAPEGIRTPKPSDP
jgi:hypothetical protein